MRGATLLVVELDSGLSYSRMTQPRQAVFRIKFAYKTARRAAPNRYSTILPASSLLMAPFIGRVWGPLRSRARRTGPRPRMSRAAKLSVTNNRCSTWTRGTLNPYSTRLLIISAPAPVERTPSTNNIPMSRQLKRVTKAHLRQLLLTGFPLRRSPQLPDRTYWTALLCGSVLEQIHPPCEFQSAALRVTSPRAAISRLAVDS